MSMRYLDQILQVQTYADGNFLDLLLPQEHFLKVPFVNIATPLYILEHPDFVEC